VHAEVCRERPSWHLFGEQLGQVRLAQRRISSTTLLDQASTSSHLHRLGRRFHGGDWKCDGRDATRWGSVSERDRSQLGEGDLSQLLTKEVPGRAFAANFGVHDPELRKQIMDLAEQLARGTTPSNSHIGSPLLVFADASYRLGEIAIALAKETPGQPHRRPDELGVPGVLRRPRR